PARRRRPVIWRRGGESGGERPDRATGAGLGHRLVKVVESDSSDWSAVNRRVVADCHHSKHPTLRTTEQHGEGYETYSSRDAFMNKCSRNLRSNYETFPHTRAFPR